MTSMVILRTGEEVEATLVKVTMLALRALAEVNPIALFEFVELCRDPKRSLFGNTGKVLRERALVGEDGQPHDTTRRVVLAAAEGKGIKLKLVWPAREEDQIRKERASAKIRDLRDREFYALMRKVVDTIFDHAALVIGPPHSHKLKRTEWVKQGPNPYYNQTADGLYLDLAYGPNLWTPWGKIEISLNGHCVFADWEPEPQDFDRWGEESKEYHKRSKKALASLLERFGATLHEPYRHIPSHGDYGPIYALHKVGDTPLPDPVELDRTAYASGKESNAAWEELTAQFEAA